MKCCSKLLPRGNHSLLTKYGWLLWLCRWTHRGKGRCATLMSGSLPWDPLPQPSQGDNACFLKPEQCFLSFTTDPIISYWPVDLWSSDVRHRGINSDNSFGVLSKVELPHTSILCAWTHLILPTMLQGRFTIPSSWWECWGTERSNDLSTVTQFSVWGQYLTALHLCTKMLLQKARKLWEPANTAPLQGKNVWEQSQEREKPIWAGQCSDATTMLWSQYAGPNKSCDSTHWLDFPP